MVSSWEWCWSGVGWRPNSWQRCVPPTTVDTLLYSGLDDDEAEMPEPELDLDKSWHGIHYLLTGTA